MEVLEIELRIKRDGVQNLFFCSDLHLEEKGHDRDRLMIDFDEALKRNARIFINGDVFGAINFSDKRYSKGNDNLQKDDFVSEVVETGVKALLPYVNIIDGVGVGNHETKFLKVHHSDLVRLLIGRLNTVRSNDLPLIRHMGYSGYLNFKVKRIAVTGKKESTGRFSYQVHYNHGQGGSHTVTKGTLKLTRRAEVYIAHCIWEGHMHKRTSTDVDMVMLNHLGDLKVMERIGIVSGCYLKQISQSNADDDGYGINYGEEACVGIQSQGGCWVQISFDKSGNPVYEYSSTKRH